MLSQLHMAKSGTFVYQRMLQVVANNIANAQTVGFKKRRTEVESLFPLVLERAVSEFDDVSGAPGKKRKRYIEYGQGVRITNIRKDFSNGVIEVTNRPLDIALEGRGFLQFRMPDGTYGYGRAGNLQKNQNGDILNANGFPLDPPLTIPRNVQDIIINQEGRVFAVTAETAEQQEIGQILLAHFPNEEGLKDIGQNLYKETVMSGEVELKEAARGGMASIRQRSLEFSNVNIIEEMMAMLMTQRAFEVIIKSMKSADDMLKTGADLK